jgi:GNAT superfamily N-acetyltransferase
VTRLTIVTYPEPVVPPALRLQVVRLQDLAWPPAEPSGVAAWHDPLLRPLSVLLLDGDRVVSALDILSAQIGHAGQSFAASGISAMVTDPGARGRGFGRRLAEAARELMAASGADLGIFTCDSELQRFYESAGWGCLPGSVLIGGTPEQPFPSDQSNKVVMASFFSVRARRASPGFAAARIELYPGLIDKLW